MRLTICFLIGTFFCLHHTTAQHINRKALDRLVQVCKDTHSTGLSLWINGKPYKDFRFDTTEQKTAAYSAQKSLISLAIGKLVTDGKLASIDTPVYRYYPEWKQGLKKTITIRHLLSHTSALEVHESDPDGWDPPNGIQYSLCASVIDTPGHYFLYSDRAVFLLHGIIEKISGERMDQYIAHQLFEPLGITDYRWDADASGTPSLLHISPAAFIRIGQLVLNKGTWNGRQLISPEWIAQSMQQSQPFVPDCGLLWWRIPEQTLYIVDEELLQAFRKAGVPEDFVRKFGALKGTYENVNIPEDKLKAVFGAGWKAVLDRELYPYYPVRARHRLSDRYIGYKAEGWMGQYIVIYPAKNLVACRMIKQSASGADTELRDFERYVYGVVE